MVCQSDYFVSIILIFAFFQKYSRLYPSDKARVGDASFDNQPVPEDQSVAETESKKEK